MILLSACIIFIMLARWQTVHIHTTYARPYIGVFHVGQVVYHLGVRATVIDVKTTDMVLVRDISGLFLPRRR